MKTHTITTYTIEELKEQFPEGYKRALSKWQKTNYDNPWMDETIESLKELIEQTDRIILRDWNLGPYNRNNYVEVDFDNDVGSFSGKRAIAWLENNLLYKLRVPYTGPERAKLRKYGSAYYAGRIKPCPFTGYCADEDFLKDLRESIRSGMTLKESFEGLAGKCASLLESDCETVISENDFFEDSIANAAQYTESGERFF